ncbi:MAG: DUF1565 domain-containing protein [Polyangiales bacterium]
MKRFPGTPATLSIRVSAVLVSCLAFALACGDDDTPSVGDAAVDAVSSDAGADATVEVVPAEPEYPLWACPSGWISRDVVGARACDLPVTDTTCGAGRAHFVGGEGCEDVGAACPAEGERFAADLPAETIFVAPDATGDGTRANPFGTLADAFSVVTSGDVVALAAGDHEADALQLPNGVRLVGACAARTRVLGAVGADFAFGGGGGRSATLENLTIRQAAIAVGVAGEVTLRGVVIESIVGAGLAVTSTGRLRLEDVVVRDVEPAGTSGGMALLVDGGQVDGTRVILEDALRSALRVMGGRATFDRLRAWARPFGSLSRGVGAWVTGGEVTLRHVDLRGATNTAVEVSGEGVVALSDVLANEIEEVDPPGVFALYAREGGRLTVDRAWVRGQGWLVHADDATVAVRDTILEGLPGGRLYAENVGVVSFSSPFELERVVVTGTSSGLLANGPFDFEIDPEAPPPPPADPIAFAIADLHLVDVGADVRFGYGVSLDVPFVGPLARVHGERIKGIALDSSGDVAFQDLRLFAPVAGGDVDGNPSFAHGLVVRAGSATLERAIVEDTFEVAIDVRGGDLALSDVTIRRAHERPCAVDTCPEAPGGTGLGAYFDATVRAENLVVDGADLCGVQLAFDGAIDLIGGAIRGTTVGACVQVDGYDVRRLAGGVRYEDNGTNVETTSHAVPEAPPPPRL